MKDAKFAAIIQGIAASTGALTALFTLLNLRYDRVIFLTLAISFGTTCYHFVMRLVIGALVTNCFDYRTRWFQPMKFEAALYRKLRLKRWKDRMPTYEPALFSLQHNTLEQIVCNMCQAEVVHEIIILCSFIPLLFSIIWDAFAVFLVTSVLAAGIDLLFVMLQRYNRPRIVRLLESKRRRPDHE